MGKDKYRKSIKPFLPLQKSFGKLPSVDSLNKRIAEHKEKQQTAKSREFFHYWEKEIQKFEREKKKKQKWL